MLRQIVTPLESSFTLYFPDDMVGKTVEIIAFELQEAETEVQVDDTDNLRRIARIQEITKTSLVDLSNYKFDRDEANNYSE